MQLSEFLATVPELTDEDAKAAARAHFVKAGKIIEATTFNSLMQGFKLTGVVKQIANDPTHPAYHDMVAIEYAMTGNHPFSFIEGTVAGDGAIMTMNRLIETDLTEYAVPLTQLLQTVIYLANPIIYPLVNTTLYEVKYVRGTIERKDLVPDGRFVTVTTKADCEKHNASIYGLNPRTQQWQSIQAFRNVEKAGTYDAEIPSFAYGWQLRVDDAYGVM